MDTTNTYNTNSNPQKVSKDSSNNKLISSLLVIAIAILFFCLFPGVFAFLLLVSVIIYTSTYASYNYQRKVELENAKRIEAIKTSFEEIRKEVKADFERAKEPLPNPHALRRQHDLQDMQNACNKVARDNALQGLESQFELAKGLNKVIHDIMSMKQDDPLGDSDQQDPNASDTFDQDEEDFEGAPTFDQDKQ